MKKLAILMAGFAVLAHSCAQSEKLPTMTHPTEIIIKFLKKSGTIYFGSDSWKKDFERLARASASTNYAQGPACWNEHTGIAAWDGIPGNNNGGVHATFELNKDGNTVLVLSQITIREGVQKGDNPKETERLYKQAYAEIREGKRKTETTISDTCSKCKVIAHILQFSPENGVQREVTMHCKTKIPYEDFMFR